MKSNHGRVMLEIIGVLIYIPNVINNGSLLLLSINLGNVRPVTDLFQRNM